MNDDYMTAEEHGDTWRLWLGDSCERMAEIPDDSVGLSVYSPPFGGLYLKPPSSGGLCEGDITTPSARPLCLPAL